jgi:hypothetical protein
MRLTDGLTEWCGDLKKIYVTPEVRGIERVFDLTIFALMIVTLSQIIQFFWGRRGQGPSYFVDVYVLAAIIVLGCLLWVSDGVPWVSAGVAGYLLGSTIIVLFNVLFLTKLSFIGPVASNERTLLLFILNVAQVVLAFAIFYRLKLHIPASDALFNTLLVFGTVGYPLEAEAIVGLQIAIDFLLLALFLAFFVGRLGAQQKPPGQ